MIDHIDTAITLGELITQMRGEVHNCRQGADPNTRLCLDTVDKTLDRFERWQAAQELTEEAE